MNRRRKTGEDETIVWADPEVADPPEVALATLTDPSPEFRIRWDPSWNVGPAVGTAVQVLEPPARPIAALTRRAHVRLGDLLVDRNHVTPVQLDLALAEHALSGRRLGTELVALGMWRRRSGADARRPVLGDQ